MTTPPASLAEEIDAMARRLEFGCPFKPEGVAEYDVPALERVAQSATALLLRCKAALVESGRDALMEAENICADKAFMCHAHDDFGKGRERGMLECVSAIKQARDKLL